jgi:hypothetical protein
MPDTGDHRLGGLALDLPDDLAEAFAIVAALKERGLAPEVYAGDRVGWIPA